MSDQDSPSTHSSNSKDGLNDALAATAVITIITIAVVFWLSGMPS